MIDDIVMMYVCFDKNFDIKMITPVLPVVTDGISMAIVPLSDVEDFSTGIKNPFDYYVSVSENPAGKTYKILKKKTHTITYTRTLDNYLTKVDKTENDEGIINIINDLYDKTISVYLSKSFMNLFHSNDINDIEEIKSFPRIGLTQLYFTLYNNPYILLKTIQIDISVLLIRPISFQYTEDLSNASLFTKKIVKEYAYFVRSNV